MEWLWLTKYIYLLVYWIFSHRVDKSIWGLTAGGGYVGSRSWSVWCGCPDGNGIRDQGNILRRAMDMEANEEKKTQGREDMEGVYEGLNEGIGYWRGYGA